MPETTDQIITRGIVIRQPWIEHILCGEKRWELRGRTTNIRGPVALIEGGAGRLLGVAVITDSLGPLTREGRARAAKRGDIPNIEVDEDMYENVYAWAVEDVLRLTVPVPYIHPSGAVIWVTLDPKARSAVNKKWRERSRAPIGPVVAKRRTR